MNQRLASHKISNELNQENLSLVRFVSQLFDSALYTPVFKFLPGGDPSLESV